MSENIVEAFIKEFDWIPKRYIEAFIEWLESNDYYITENDWNEHDYD